MFSLAINGGVILWCRDEWFLVVSCFFHQNSGICHKRYR